MLPIFGLSLLFSIALCIHAVRTGQQIYWLMIILAFQPLGGLVYLIAIVVPGWTGGAGAQRFSRTARETLDPTREYREARAACDETPTVANQMRLARATAAQGTSTRPNPSTARRRRASTRRTPPCCWAARSP